MDYNTESTPYLSMFAAVSYGIASMAMIFINKAVLMQYAHSITLLTLQVTLSVLLTATGVLIAALGDFSFDLFGYSMAFTSVFFQKSGAEDGLSSVEIMLYNSILSFSFLLFLITITGEFPNSMSILFCKSTSLSFLAILLLSPVMSIVLNYAMFLCTIVNSALTTTIVGVLKGVGSTTLGFVLLGGVQVHALNVTGLVINTAGGGWYSYSKYQQKKRNKLPKLMADLEMHKK